MTQTSSLTGPDRPADRRLRKGARIAALRDHASFVVACLMLALIVVLYGSLQAGIFSQDEINLDTTAAMTLILAATGQTIVLLRGGIDLSIGGMISLGTCIAATRFGEGALSVAGWSAFILMLGFGVGAVNGLLISVPRLQPFVATLATWSILGGVAMIVLPSDGGAVPGWWLDLGYKSVLGFTSPVWLMVALLIWWRWFISTPRGVAIKATGSSERSAFLSGVSILRINLVTYGLSGLFAAIASLYLTTQTGAGSPTIGNDYILTSIAAAVIGGVSMTGGKGGLSGMLIGAFILTLIGNLVFALHVSSYWQPVASGAILLVSVLATGLVDPRCRGQGEMKDLLLRSRVIVLAHLSVIVLLLAAGAVSPGFLTGSSLRSMLVLATFIGIASLGQTFVVIGGGIDLSIPWVLTASAVMMAVFCDGRNLALVRAIPTLLGLGGLIGFINGLVIARFGVSPIVMTLAMNVMLLGLMLVFTGGAPTPSAPSAVKYMAVGRIGPVPVVAVIWLVLTALATVLLSKTTFGRQLYALASNATVAEFSGIPTLRTRVPTFVISNVAPALCGILLAGYSGQAYLGMGDSYLFTSVAAVAIGGASILGGSGHYLGTVAGAMVLTVLNGLLPALNLSVGGIMVVYGLVILATISAGSEAIGSLRRLIRRGP